MNTKLSKGMDIKMMSIEEFDSIESEHEFSTRYEMKKEHLLAGLDEAGKIRYRRRMMRVAMATFAVFACSVTVAAAGYNVLKKFYKEAEIKQKTATGISAQLDDKYRAAGYSDVKPIDGVTIETDGPKDLLDFEVLKAEKGENTITYSILITINDSVNELEDGYSYVMSKVHYLSDGTTDILGETTLTEEGALGCKYIEKNQILETVNCRYDGDMSNVNELQIKYEGIMATDYWNSSGYTIFNYGPLKGTIVADGTLVVKPEQFAEGVLKPYGIRPIDTTHKWTVHIPLQTNYEEKIAKDVGKYELFGRNVDIKEIRISPHVLRINFDNLNNKASEHELKGNDFFGELLKNVYLLMEDGAKVKLSDNLNEDGTGMSDGEDTAQVDCTFTIPIDTNKLTGIEIGGNVIDLK